MEVELDRGRVGWLVFYIGMKFYFSAGIDSRTNERAMWCKVSYSRVDRGKRKYSRADMQRFLVCSVE